MQHYGLKTIRNTIVKPVCSPISGDRFIPPLPDMTFRETRLYMRMLKLERLTYLHAQIRGTDKITYKVDGKNRAMVRHNRGWDGLERLGWSMTFWKSRPHGYKICPVRKMIWVPQPTTAERMYPMVRAIHLAHLLVNMTDCMAVKKSHGPEAMAILPSYQTYVSGSTEEDFNRSLAFVNSQSYSPIVNAQKSFKRFKSVLDFETHPGRIGQGLRGHLKAHSGTQFEFPMGVGYVGKRPHQYRGMRDYAIQKGTFPFAIKPNNGVHYYAVSLYFGFLLSSLRKSAHFICGSAAWRLFSGKSKSLRVLTSLIHVMKSDVETLYALVSNKRYKQYWDGLNRDNIVSHIQSINALLSASDSSVSKLTPEMTHLRNTLRGAMCRTKAGRDRYGELFAAPSAGDKLLMPELLGRMNNVERGLANAIDELRLSVAKIVATENEKEKTQ